MDTQPVKPTKQRDPNEDKYVYLKKLTEEQLQALAELKGSLVMEAFEAYFEAKKQTITDYLLKTDLVPSAKDSKTLFKLQDAQSKLVEHMHLLGLPDKAAELLGNRLKEPAHDTKKNRRSLRHR